MEKDGTVAMYVLINIFKKAMQKKIQIGTILISQNFYALNFINTYLTST